MDKDSTEKNTQGNLTHDYRCKILNKILANKFYQYILKPAGIYSKNLKQIQYLKKKKNQHNLILSIELMQKGHLTKLKIHSW